MPQENGDILQGTGEDHTGEEEVPEADIRFPPEGQDDGNGAEAVDWAEGAVEEASVYQGVGGTGAEDGFVDPAEEAIEDKPEKDLCRGDHGEDLLFGEW